MCCNCVLPQLSERRINFNVVNGGCMAATVAENA